jgi:iron(III) transport system ATP-binding protein
MIAVEGLAKTFASGADRVGAVRNLTLDVAEGEFVVLVGASGSGKTSLLRCIAGLEKPDSGRIVIGGRTVFADQPPLWVPPQERQLGMVFQSYAIWPHMTVFQNVALPLKTGAHRVPSGEVRPRVLEALRLVQLDGLGDRPAMKLSGGQQQRVALARAVAVNSRLLLMDEPLSNLDARLREEVRIQILELVKKLGTTVLYVTHDQIEAMAMADRIGLMRFGELLQVGKPTQVYRHTVQREVADFFGHVNWLPGTILDREAVETPVGRLRSSKCESLDRGTAVLAGFRPESVILGGECAPGLGSFAASLTSSMFLGDAYLHKLTAAGLPILAKTTEPLAAGDDQVTLSVRPESLFVFAQDSVARQ